MNARIDHYRIREANVDDALVISRLIVPLTEQYILSDLGTGARQALLKCMSEDGIRSLMSEGCRYHLAERQGQAIAVIGIHKSRHLYHLFVDVEFQRRGIARRLWDEALKSCLDETSVETISVNAAPSAKRFYERLGFIPSGEATERNGITTIPMQCSLKIRK